MRGRKQELRSDDEDVGINNIRKYELSRKEKVGSRKQQYEGRSKNARQ